MSRIFNYNEDGKLKKSVVTSTVNGVTTYDTSTFDNRDRLQKAMDNYTQRTKRTRFELQVTGNVLTFILAFLIIVALARTLTGVQGMPTFGSFISMLQNMPNIELSITSFEFLQITGDWGILDGLRVFLNSLSSILSFGIWMVLGLVQVVIFAISLVGWIFGV